MKRIISFILSIIFVLAVLAPSVCAQGTKEKSEKEFLNAVTFSCTYDVKKRQIFIDGTVRHDFMISHGEYTIKVYSVMPGEKYESVIADPEREHLAQTDMTVKFNFYIDADSISERYSKYAIVLCSPAGENFLAGQPMLPSISSELEYDTAVRSNFKGISTESPIDVGSSGAGTVVVDVDISKTVGDAADSILYPMRDTYIHMRKSYIRDIDDKVLSASLNGAKVYLRLLLRADSAEYAIASSNNKNTYSMPNLYSERVLEYIFTLSEFLCDRYDGTSHGKACGMIAGIRIDDTKSTNQIGGLSVDEYAELYTLYLVVVGNAARAVRKDFDIVIPLSDRNDYDGNTYINDTVRPTVLLEAIAYRLDENVSGDFDCTVMIESQSSPVKISELSDTDFEAVTDKTLIGPDTVDSFISFLKKLSKKYQSAPTNVIYMWSAENGIYGNELCCAYIYTYLKLYDKNQISSFVVKLDEDAYKSLKNVIRHIDTANSSDVISPFCKYLGVDTWSACIDAPVNITTIHSFYDKSFTSAKPSGVSGEFGYMDFTASSIYNLMLEGHNCDYIRSDYDSHGTRILRVGASLDKVGAAVETVGIFEYPESYIYTPTLSLIVGVEDKSANADALYEVTLTLGTKDAQTYAVGVLKNGEDKELFFDASDFAGYAEAEYIKISARALTQKSENFSILLHDIKGYSTEYSNEQLKELIEAKRLEIRNQSVEDGGEFDFTLVMTIAGVVFAMSMLGVGLAIIFKRDEDSSEK